MKKILFLIHDLSHGGAEKVLVNLANGMDKTKFEITVMALFGGGINEQFLSPQVRYIPCFKKQIRGNSHIMKLFTPKQLHRMFIKDKYDIEVAYTEGVPARIISACPDLGTKKVCWIHCTMQSEKELSVGFRSFKEAIACYGKFDSMSFVSSGVKEAFNKLCSLSCPQNVLYNTNDTDSILKLMNEPVTEGIFSEGELKIAATGKIVPTKGFDRLARITKCLYDDGINIHTYILGIGSQRDEIDDYIKKNGILDRFTFLGYQTNPYKFLSKCDLFVCSSLAEGFSTAATEALIVGTPVCTVRVSGMSEMLGDNNEYGVIADNDEQSLYEALKDLLSDPSLLAHYKSQAKKRGRDFSAEKTVKAVETMLVEL